MTCLYLLQELHRIFRYEKTDHLFNQIFKCDITNCAVVSNLLTITTQITYLADLVQISDNLQAVTGKTVIFLKVRIELMKNKTCFFNVMNLNARQIAEYLNTLSGSLFYFSLKGICVSSCYLWSAEFIYNLPQLPIFTREHY